MKKYFTQLPFFINHLFAFLRLRVIALVIILFCTTVNVWGQTAASATWAFSSTGAPTIVGNVSGNTITPPSTGIAGYGTTAISSGLTISQGASSGTWQADGSSSTTTTAFDGCTATSNGSPRYIQFNITPASNNNLTVNNITIPITQTGTTTTLYYAVAYSTDNFTTTGFTIITAGTTGGVNLSTGSTTFSYTNPTISVNNGTTLSVRLIVWKKNNTTVSSTTITIGTVVISGTTVPTCAPTIQASGLSSYPVTAASTSLVLSTRGNGTGGVLIVAYPGALAGAAPTSGTSYNTVSTTYGSGSAIGTGYVVYNSNGTAPISFTVTGLPAYGTYTFAAYEYNSSGTCYNTSSPPTAGFAPVVVTNPTSPWTVPANVNSVKVEVWGGGGGGGGSSSGTSVYAGAGGGGGAYSSDALTVSAGQTYTISSANGGAGGYLNSMGTGGVNSTDNGVAGGTITFTGTGGTVIAAGGAGGAANSISSTNGGATASCTGSTKLAGGKGAGAWNYASSSYTVAGGGGGGAGSASAGTDAPAVSNTSGVGGAGGAGGAGSPNVAPYAGGNGASNTTVSASVSGSSGLAPGGGGSGGCSWYYSESGGNGGAGQVVLTYVVIPCLTPGTPTSVAGAATGSNSASLSWAAGSPTGSSTVTYNWSLGTNSAGSCPTTQTINYTGSITTWTVPTGVSSLTITAKGASGGYVNGQTPGYGASMTGTFSVSPNQVLSILVGQSPGLTTSYTAGGGGTFVAMGSNNATATPMIVAGGGGGAYNATGVGAPTTNNGTGTNGGTAGNGASQSSCGGGGGGFYSSGYADALFSYAGGNGFRQGGTGGIGASGYQNGGFGGGACADYYSTCNSQAGSGGGYGGGSGTSTTLKTYGEAGGSYNGGTNQTNIANSNNGNGQVTITYAPTIDQGTTSGLSASTSALSASTTYYLTVYANTSCDGSSSACATSTAFTTSAACTTPTAYAVSGGGGYCTGTSGVAVGLANSQTGVNYQLIRGGSTNVGSPVAGTTGSAINFGLQTTVGTYTVQATTTSGGCTASMTGSVTVSVTTPNVGTSPATGVTNNGVILNGTD